MPAISEVRTRRKARAVRARLIDFSSLLSNPGVWAAIFIAAGVIARLIVFVRKPSFHQDELSLILNILQRDYIGLISGKLDFQQAAPIGFLWLEKASTQLFGVSEYSLRLVSLIAGVGVLPLLWYVGRLLLGPWVGALAAILVSIAPTCIYYSNEAKQYSVELFVATALMAILASSGSGINRKRALLLAGAGVAAVALSVSAVFVLGGMGFVFLYRIYKSGFRRRELLAYLAICAIWIVAFGLSYALFFSPQAREDGGYMARYWAPAYLPNQQGGRAIASLVEDGFLNPLVSVGDRVPAPYYFAAVVIFLAGILAAGTAWPMETLILLMSPLLLSVAAAALGKWVFATRVMLFSVPMVSMLIAGGAHWVSSLCEQKWGYRFSFALACVLLTFPLKGFSYLAKTNPEVESNRSPIEFCMREFRPGDVVYLYARSVPAWMYYSTDWNAPDYSRLRWLYHASFITGPNGGNHEPRDHRVDKEGWDLRRPYRGGVEMVGIADGIVRNAFGSTRIAPDSGWRENEFARVLKDSHGRVIAVGISVGEHGLPDLVEYFQNSGARTVTEFNGLAAHVYLFDLTALPRSLTSRQPGPEPVAGLSRQFDSASTFGAVPRRASAR